MNNPILEGLQNIKLTYQSMFAFFYQKINQTVFTNNGLKVYTIDYSLLLPSSQLLTNLNTNQVSAQMQAYVQKCEELTTLITTTLNVQNNIFYERIKNTLDNSITQISNFATSLLNAKYNNLFNYTTPYVMGFSTALYLNKIDLSTYDVQATLNYNLLDFNAIPQNTVLTFFKG